MSTLEEVPIAIGMDSTTSTSDTPWRSEIDALRAEVHALRERETARPSAEEPGNLENIYSYAVHAVLTQPPLGVLISCIFSCSVTVLASIFAFTYFDASWLSHVQSDGGYNLFGGIGAVNYYLYANEDGTPKVVFVARYIGCILLSTMARAEDVETLSTANPAAVILCQFGMLRGCCYWRVIPLIFLLFCWVLRALLVPLFIVLGVGHALAATGTALDIVLNAGAAGFILDLDSMGYTLLVPPRHRDEYESAPPHPISPLLAERTATLVEVYTWLLWVPAVIASFLVLQDAWQISQPEIVVLLIVRGAVLGIAHAHIAFETWRAARTLQATKRANGTSKDQERARMVMGAGLVALIGLSIFLARYVAYQWIYWEVLNTHLGFDGPINEPCLLACLDASPSDVNATACYDKPLVGTCGLEWTGYSYGGQWGSEEVAASEAMTPHPPAASPAIPVGLATVGSSGVPPPPPLLAGGAAADPPPWAPPWAPPAAGYSYVDG